MLKTPVSIPHQSIIDYHSTYQFLGSCFSEHLLHKMHQFGFKVGGNPFGVIFNPISLAEIILCSDEELMDSVFMRDDVALSWLANSILFDYNKDKLQEKLVALRQTFIQELSTSKILFVTFGTTYIYEKNETNKVVANCHKIPQNQFKKRLLNIDEITEVWSKAINKLSILSQMYGEEIQIVFTVSPVRHIKDGIVENSHSKAILLAATHELVNAFSNVSYFPSYEIMIDELRDYAYYKRDGIHPNEIAIDEIWNKFRATYFTEKTLEINAELIKLLQFLNHRLLHPESEKSKDLIKEQQVKLKAFKEKYPMVDSNHDDR